MAFDLISAIGLSVALGVSAIIAPTLATKVTNHLAEELSMSGADDQDLVHDPSDQSLVVRLAAWGVFSALSLLTIMRLGGSIPAIAILLLAYGLLISSLVDLRHKLLPDIVTIPLLWIGLLLNIYEIFATLESAVLGVAIGYAFLFLISRGFLLVTGREGLGDGDIKLLAMLGAWGGWQILPGTLLLASLAGFVLAIIYARLSMDESSTFPFGPAIAFGGILNILYGPSVPWFG
jgi:prepilin signal peptidase PulO-like enzyme (type II secretory pathway)